MLISFTVSVEMDSVLKTRGGGGGEGEGMMKSISTYTHVLKPDEYSVLSLQGAIILHRVKAQVI